MEKSLKLVKKMLLPTSWLMDTWKGRSGAWPHTPPRTSSSRPAMMAQPASGTWLTRWGADPAWAEMPQVRVADKVRRRPCLGSDAPSAGGWQGEGQSPAWARTPQVRVADKVKGRPCLGSEAPSRGRAGPASQRWGTGLGRSSATA